MNLLTQRKGNTYYRITAHCFLFRIDTVEVRQSNWIHFTIIINYLFIINYFLRVVERNWGISIILPCLRWVTKGNVNLLWNPSRALDRELFIEDYLSSRLLQNTYREPCVLSPYLGRLPDLAHVSCSKQTHKCKECPGECHQYSCIQGGDSK